MDFLYGFRFFKDQLFRYQLNWFDDLDDDVSVKLDNALEQLDFSHIYK